MFRKTAAPVPAPTATLDDEIPEDALATIPEIGNPNEVEADPGDGEELQAMVADLRDGLQAAFSREMDSVERTFLASVRELQERVRNAESESARLHAHNAELTRKAEALKQLSRAIES
jgi:hypothetical protein